jgi:hypothetical protein
VEDVAGDEDDVRRELDDAIDGGAECRRDVRLPLIHAGGSQSLILPKTEVEVRQMD